MSFPSNLPRALSLVAFLWILDRHLPPGPQDHELQLEHYLHAQFALVAQLDG